MLLAFSIPLLIMLGTALLCLLPLSYTKLRQQEAWRRGLLVLGLGLGLLAGYTRMLPAWWQDFPPADTTRWLPFFWCLFIGLALWQSWRPLRRLKAAGFGLVLTSVLALLILRPLHKHSLWIDLSLALALGICVAGYQSLLKRLDERQPAWLSIGVLLLLMGASGWVFFLGSSALLAQQAWMLSLGLLVPVIWLLKDQQLKPEGLGILICFALAALWLPAVLFTNTPLWSPGLLIVTGMPWLRRWPVLVALPAWLADGLILLITLVILVVALFTLWPAEGLYLG